MGFLRFFLRDRNQYRLCLSRKLAVVTASAVIASSLVFAPVVSQALPIYTDALWFDSSDPKTIENSATVKKAAQVNRLTGYIQETYNLPYNKTVAIVTEAIHHAKKHNFQPELILAVIAVESTFRERAVSSVGARGLMQVLPKAHPKKVKAIGGIDQLFDTKKNIATGVKILNEYLAMSKGNLRNALLRYNGSLKHRNPPYARKVMRMYNKLKRVTAQSDVT